MAPGDGAPDLSFLPREPPLSDPPDPDATGTYHPPPPLIPAGETFAPGAVLAGRYRMVAAIGKGGMGEIYRADDLALGQSVALQVLPAGLSRDPDRPARFHNVM